MKTIATDIAVVGAGVAGMTAALHAGDRRVVVLTKSAFGSGGASPLAQGGVAAAVGAMDSPEAHAADTIAAGAGLCREAVVGTVTAEGPARIAELVADGVRFDRAADGRFGLGREGAHSRDRILHAAGDATGAELVRALGNRVAADHRIEILEHHLVLELLVEGGRVVGLVAVDRSGHPVVVSASHVVLASGGLGQLWARTTNPAEATGDGLALAAAAGARSANLEFVQFHPTALDAPARPMALLTEALRGEGAVLIDADGVPFMAGEHPRADLAPRDVVARAIARRRALGSAVFLDARGLGRRLAERFPTVARLCSDHGFDPANEPVPVAPAAHYHMGGVVTDIDGRTSLPGLSACGEVACTGLHGANRLASNSLLEAIVVGARCGERLARSSARPPRAALSAVPHLDRSPWLADGEYAAAAGELRWIMENAGGVVRSQTGLAAARESLADLQRTFQPGPGEFDAMVRVAAMVLRAAAARTESRGAHFRSDVPWPSPCWRQDLVFVGERLIPPRAAAAAAV